MYGEREVLWTNATVGSVEGCVSVCMAGREDVVTYRSVYSMCIWENAGRYVWVYMWECVWGI